MTKIRDKKILFSGPRIGAVCVDLPRQDVGEKGQPPHCSWVSAPGITSVDTSRSNPAPAGQLMSLLYTSILIKYATI
jgi:hypothetical protein